MHETTHDNVPHAQAAIAPTHDAVYPHEQYMNKNAVIIRDKITQRKVEAGIVKRCCEFFQKSDYDDGREAQELIYSSVLVFTF